MDNRKDTLKGELVAFGADNYLHDKTKSMNYYAQIKKDDGTISERWGKDLESVIQKSGVQVGDTVVLAEIGKEPIVVGDKTFNKTVWELQKYEALRNLPNVIENDSEREREKQITNTEETKEKEQDKEATNPPKTIPDLSEFDWQPPDNIKNNYIGVVKNRYLLGQKTNYYDKNDKDQINIAFEDRNKSLHTSRQDEKTIYAMLDMAQSKGWSAIKLKGTEEFKQKAWLEASLRGIEVKGYTPTEKDLAQLQAKQQERTTNQVEMTAQKVPETKADIGEQKADKDPAILDIPAYHIFDNKQQDKAYLERIGVDFAGVKADRQALNFNKVKENAKEFTGKELTNFHSGIKATISNNSLGKMLSGKAHEKSVDLKTHLIAVSNADKLFENAVFGWQHEHKGADKNLDIGTIHRAIAPLKIDDEIYLAKLTVKELTHDGNRLYSIEAVEIEHEKSPIPEMVANDLGYKTETDRHNRALIDSIVQNAQKYNKEHQKNIDDLQNDNTEQAVIHTQKSAKELKQEIKTIFQNGYNNGTIKSRDELVEVLKNRGYVVKENEKSISISEPNSNKLVNLKNEVFTKRLDDIKALKQRLEPETLKQTYPTLKDSDIVHITAYKNKLFDDSKDKPKALQAKLEHLEKGVKALAQGKDLNLPSLPVKEIKPDVQVSTTKNHDKTQSR